MRIKIAVAVTLVVTAAFLALVAGRETGASAATSASKITLVAYSTPREAYAKIVPAFQATAAGRDVDVEQSYGASGEQTRAIIAGLRADVVHLSLEPDVTSLVQAKLVSPSWKNEPYGGTITRSIVVFAVRPGNPKKIKDWGDLIKPGVDVVTPNPFTSGGARWNVMAAYGAQRKKGRSHAQAVGYLRSLFRHVVSLDKSARESLQTFLAGRGDVMLAYENEARFARSKGQPLEYVIPRASIRIDNPVAVLRNARNPVKARAFVRFLRTRTAQRIYAQNGYRPVLRSALKGFSFPVRPQMFSIGWLGGWAKIEKRFFDPRRGIMVPIVAQAGG